MAEVIFGTVIGAVLGVVVGRGLAYLAGLLVEMWDQRR